MKKRLVTTAVALLGAVLTTGAHATPISYNVGDIILGFETTGGNNSGGTKNLLIDLGQYSNFSNFSTFNVSSDLNAVFGSGNWSSGQISFGAFGVTISGSHYSNIYETALNNTLKPVASGSQTVKIAYNALTANTGIGYQELSYAQNSNSWTGYGVEQSSSTSGSWGSYNPSASAFSVTGDSIETTIGSSLNLYDKVYGGAGTVVSTPYTVSVDALGNINIATVPEPASYALLGLAFLVLAIAYRRFSNKKPATN